jgi:hypothetical protein
VDCEQMTGNSSTIGLSKARRLLAWSLPVATQIHPSANRSRMLTQTFELMDGRASLEETAHGSSRPNSHSASQAAGSIVARRRGFARI